MSPPDQLETLNIKIQLPTDDSDINNLDVLDYSDSFTAMPPLDLMHNGNRNFGHLTLHSIIHTWPAQPHANLAKSSISTLLHIADIMLAGMGVGLVAGTFLKPKLAKLSWTSIHQPGPEYRTSQAMLLGSKAAFAACHAISAIFLFYSAILPCNSLFTYVLNSDKVLGDFFDSYLEFLTVNIIKLQVARTPPTMSTQMRAAIK